MLYACPTWWNSTKCMAKPLEKVQHKALRLICAAFRTTPIRTLEVEASIPHIRFQADLITRRYATRLNKLPNASPVIKRLPNAWRDNKPPLSPPPSPLHTSLRENPLQHSKKYPSSLATTTRDPIPLPPHPGTGPYPYSRVASPSTLVSHLLTTSHLGKDTSKPSPNYAMTPT